MPVRSSEPRMYGPCGLQAFHPSILRVPLDFKSTPSRLQAPRSTSTSAYQWPLNVRTRHKPTVSYHTFHEFVGNHCTRPRGINLETCPSGMIPPKAPTNLLERTNLPVGVRRKVASEVLGTACAAAHNLRRTMGTYLPSAWILCTMVRAERVLLNDLL